MTLQRARKRGESCDSCFVSAGLGLAIVHGIAEAHQGSVRVLNTEGGCRFEMRLPACR